MPVTTAEGPWGRAQQGAPTGAAGWIDLAAMVWLWIAGALVLWTFRDYGVTWDEDWHIVYGQHVLDYWATGGHVDKALTYRTDFLYGGGFDVLAGAVARAFPDDHHHAVHFVNAAIGWLGLLGVWRLGRRLARPQGGLLALILCSLTPAYWGAMFNNPKDLPFAVGYVWALVAIAWTISALPAARWRHFVALGVALGLACSVRIAGLVTLMLAGFAIAAWIAHRTWWSGRLDAAPRIMTPWIVPMTASIAIAWGVMLLAWPWAQLDPLRRPLIALSRMSYFNQHVRRMPFAGASMWTYDVRPDYLLHYFGLQLPALLLVGLLLGIACVAAVVAAATRRRPERGTEAIVALVVLLSIVGPPAYAMAKRSILYDGLRHFLFLIPPICALSAWALVSVHACVAARSPRAAAIALSIVCIAQADVLVRMIRLHPHQYVFFNRVGGGLPGAFLRYDTDYYGNTYKEAYEDLFDRLWREDRQRFLHNDWVVTGCIPAGIARSYLPPNVHWKPKGVGRAVFYAGYTRGDCHAQFPNAPEVLRVERERTMLNVVKDLRTPGHETSDFGFLDDPPSTRDKRRRAGKHAAESQPAPATDDRPASPPDPDPVDAAGDEGDGHDSTDFEPTP